MHEALLYAAEVKTFAERRNLGRARRKNFFICAKSWRKMRNKRFCHYRGQNSTAQIQFIRARKILAHTQFELEQRQKIKRETSLSSPRSSMDHRAAQLMKSANQSCDAVALKKLPKSLIIPWRQARSRASSQFFARFGVKLRHPACKNYFEGSFDADAGKEIEKVFRRRHQILREKLV